MCHFLDFLQIRLVFSPPLVCSYFMLYYIYIYIYTYLYICIILFVFQRIISAPLFSHFILITPLFLFIKFHAPLGSVYNFAFDVNLFFPMSVSYNSSTFGKFWSLGIFVFIFPSYKLV